MQKFTIALIYIFVHFGTLTSPAAGQCNVCSSENNLACVSATKFQVCVNGSPIGPVNSCPSGFVCSGVNAYICQANSASVVIACSDCNRCDPTLTFACTDAQNYALCLGTTQPSATVTGSCGTGLVCSIDYPQICGRPDLGVSATCPTVNEETTTAIVTTTWPSLESYPQLYCQQTAKTGRYPVTNTKQYIYCFISGGVWYGALYTCPGSTFFNSATGMCA